ncbi:MAG: hypothetical protein PHE53_07270 [Thermoguttaceae bacterium]|nr:hypothetical protein [Thermoguttaceae bacterium]
MRTQGMEWLRRGLVVGISLSCLGYGGSLYAGGCEALPTQTLPCIAGKEKVREAKYVDKEEYAENGDRAANDEVAEEANDANRETQCEGYTKWRIMPKKMICFKPIEVKPIKFKPIEFKPICIKPIQMPQLCLPKPVFKPVPLPSIKSLFVCPRCQELICQCRPSGCEAEEDVAPSGCEAEENVAPSGCEAEEDVAPSGCGAKEDVAPSGCGAKEDVAPSGCEAEEDVAPSGCGAEEDVAPSGCGAKEDVADTGCDTECATQSLPCPGLKLIHGLFQPKMVAIPVPAMLCPPTCEASNGTCNGTECD